MSTLIILPCKGLGCPGHVEFKGEDPPIPFSAFKLFHHITPDNDVLFSLIDEQGHKAKQLEDTNLILREVKPNTFADSSHELLRVKESTTGDGIKEYILPYTAATQTHNVYLKCDDFTVGPHNLPYKLTY